MRFFDRKVRPRKAYSSRVIDLKAVHAVNFACVQGFYSVHGEDAVFIARQFYKTTAVVKYLGQQDSGLPGMLCA